MHKIVVLGAGYAGLTAAVSLAGRTRKQDVRVTVVSASERFTERLRLHQVASGQELKDLRIPDLLRGTGIELVTGWVTGIDPETRTVRVDDERIVRYDTLVYALGSVTDTRAVPGADDHAFTLDGPAEATVLANRLAGGEHRTVAVCGGGLTGIEAAAELAERHPGLDVVLLAREEPGAAFGPAARRHLDHALRRLGVRVRADSDIVKVLPHGVELAGGETVAADVVLWVGGVRVAPLAAAAGLTVDDRGRIVTDAFLRSVSHPDVYAIGDAAAIRQRYGMMHGTCQSGMPTGVHAAATIVRALAGKAPRPFRFGYFHTPVSLGRGDAVVQFTHPDGSPRRMYLTGRRAAWYKETVSASPWPGFARTYKLPASGMFAWRRGGKYTR
ncbi:FAD-dependent oxidoreductase [Dactylosporangium sp. AC04546]|uniref:NAD(P)/FAD-dependent oxidoreductase n=1 Tax=Dactylosporangium sp. AC04546 TaxID=2862460 RepID=UPI001EDCCE32|nr:FAD-dependent oxidoreductase [Dactylosporangium sp. AC04546]WVK87797.1 FAD-dependent oxidoreductase [Dactylosporangium sp. AC04546]